MKISARKFEQAERKLEQLEHQRNQLRNRLNAQSTDRSRRDETRRKILIGSWILAMIEKGKYTEEKLRGGLDRYLERDDDRALFGLSPKNQKKEG